MTGTARSGRGSDGKPRELRLDNLTLTRKEGFGAFATADAPAGPESLSKAQLSLLGDTALAEHARSRHRWHANLRPVRTRQVEELHEKFNEIFESSLDQGGEQAKAAVALDAYPGLGKTTAVLSFAKHVHNKLIAEDGPFTAEGDERWPVCRIGMDGDTTVKDFNWAMLHFYAHAGRDSGTAKGFKARALDCVMSCETRLLVVDDLHFLRFSSTAGTQLSNHFKAIMNDTPVMILFIGYDLRDKGLYRDPQLERRTTRVGLDPFAIDDEQGRSEWRQVLLTMERQIVLAEKYPGMLADDLADYMFQRSSGHFNSLADLIRRGCHRAITTGTERLTRELLDQVTLDEAAERQRRELTRLIESGKASARPARRRTVKTDGR
jgi:hypothetical protein